MTINHAGNHNFRFYLWSHPVKSKNNCMRNIIVIRLPREFISILITSILIAIWPLPYHLCSQLASILFQNRDIIISFTSILIAIWPLPYHICSRFASIPFSNWDTTSHKSNRKLWCPAWFMVISGYDNSADNNLSYSPCRDHTPDHRRITKKKYLFGLDGWENDLGRGRWAAPKKAF